MRSIRPLRHGGVSEPKCFEQLKSNRRSFTLPERPAVQGWSAEEVPADEASYKAFTYIACQLSPHVPSNRKRCKVLTAMPSFETNRLVLRNDLAELKRLAEWIEGSAG